jgi:hypothetical protein
MKEIGGNRNSVDVQVRVVRSGPMGMTFPATCDYSYGRPSTDAIKNAGYAGAMRYLGNDDRCIYPAERDALLGAGLGIGLIWETTAGRPLDGYNAGVQDAHSANAEADELGAPGDTRIYYAVDFQPTTGELTGPISDYFHGVKSVGGREPRAYGCASVMQHLCGALGLFPDSWQCAAWSYPGTAPGTPIYDGGYNLVLSPYAHMLQNIGYVLGDTSDHNSLITADVSWMWGIEGSGEEMTDAEWSKMTSLLNTMIVGKMAVHSTPLAMVADEHGQFAVVWVDGRPKRYVFGSPDEAKMATKIGLVAPNKPTNPPAPSPAAYNVKDLTAGERDALYNYPTV